MTQRPDGDWECPCPFTWFASKGESYRAALVRGHRLREAVDGRTHPARSGGVTPDTVEISPAPPAPATNFSMPFPTGSGNDVRLDKIAWCQAHAAEIKQATAEDRLVEYLGAQGVPSTSARAQARWLPYWAGVGPKARTRRARGLPPRGGVSGESTSVLPTPAIPSPPVTAPAAPEPAPQERQYLLAFYAEATGALASAATGLDEDGRMELVYETQERTPDLFDKWASRLSTLARGRSAVAGQAHALTVAARYLRNVTALYEEARQDEPPASTVLLGFVDAAPASPFALALSTERLRVEKILEAITKLEALGP